MHTATKHNVRLQDTNVQLPATPQRRLLYGPNATNMPNTPIRRRTQASASPSQANVSKLLRPKVPPLAQVSADNAVKQVSKFAKAYAMTLEALPKNESPPPDIFAYGGIWFSMWKHNSVKLKKLVAGIHATLLVSENTYSH